MSTKNDDGFRVLSGMEVNFRLEPPLSFARIHLLTIFPEGSTPEHFGRLFGQTDIPDDAARTGNEEVTNISLRDWVELVHKEKGICIAAHVENRQGIRFHFRQTAKESIKTFTQDGTDEEREIPEEFREYIFASKLDGIEIHSMGDSQYYRWESKRDGTMRSIPCILTFDAHNIEQFNRPDRVTYLKMTSVGFRGLHDALRFPETRIRFHNSLPQSPNPRVLGVQVKGNQGSFFEDSTIAFAENLTCVIGVRGSGKSTLVEALRYTFGFNRTLGELGKLNVSIKALQQANLSNSLIRVAYQTENGDVRILSATYDEKSEYVTKVYTKSGELLEVPDVETCGDYPLRLFGWSEIEILGRESTKQRDLLDRLVTGLGPKLLARSELRSQLSANRGEIEKLIHDVKANYAVGDNSIRRYREFKADFNRLNTEDVRNLFEALDLVKAKEQLVTQLYSTATQLSNELRNQTTLSLETGLEELLERGTEALKEWWNQEEKLELGISDFQEGLRKTLGEMVTHLEDFGSHVDAQRRQLTSSREQIESDLRAQFEKDDNMQRIADLRQNAEMRLREVTAVRDRYIKSWNELIDALKTRRGLCAKIQLIQVEISGIRTANNEHLGNEVTPLFWTVG